MTRTALDASLEPSSYTTTLTIAATPADVYATINDPASWWATTTFVPGVYGEVDGASSRVGDEFVYRYSDLHRSRQRVVELVPDRRVVWLVTEGYLKFVDEHDEWAGTRVVFGIGPAAGADDSTVLTFTHDGLTPSLPCYDACSGGWNAIVHSGLGPAIERAALARSDRPV